MRRFFRCLVCLVLEVNVACKPVGKHREGDESFCTLEAFREVIEKIRPVDWYKECRVPGMI